MDDQRKEIDEQKEEMEIDLYRLLADMGKNLRRLWWLAVLLTAMGAALFCVFRYVVRTPMYESSATFTVATGEESGGFGFYYDSNTADQLSKTFPYILDSSYFRSVLLEQLGTETLNGTITAETITNSNVVTMKVDSTNPQDAYDILTSAIAVYPQAAHFVLGDITFEMLTEPTVPANPYNQPGILRTLGTGACGGFLAALVICGLLALLRRNVCSVEEMKKITSIRCLASIPRVRFKARSGKRDNRVTFQNDRLSFGYNESIRILTNRVVKAMENQGGKVLLVTSTVASEGKSVTAVNLAHKLGADGYKVLLIDGDMRKQKDRILLDVQENYGLNDVMEEEDLSGAIGQVLGNDSSFRNIGMYFLGGMTTVSQPAALLSNEKIARFIEGMRDKLDFIIIDTPPCSMFQDASVLAEYADGVLYVVKYDRLPLHKVRDGLKTIGGQKTDVIGYVFNDCPETSAGYGYGRYGYGKYGYGRYGYGRYSYGKYGSRRYGLKKDQED